MPAKHQNQIDKLADGWLWAHQSRLMAHIWSRWRWKQQQRENSRKVFDRAIFNKTRSLPRDYQYADCIFTHGRGKGPYREDG